MLMILVPIFFIKSDFTNYFADFRGHYDCITLILPAIILKFVFFHDFSHQRCLGRLLAALTAQAALMGKIMEGDNFQNYGMVQGRISIYMQCDYDENLVSLTTWAISRVR